MKIIKIIIAIIIIFIISFIIAFTINIVGLGEKEDIILYHLTVYDEETYEILEDWESHHITVEETDEYIEFYCVKDDGSISFRHWLKENRKIKYNLTETLEKQI